MEKDLSEAVIYLSEYLLNSSYTIYVYVTIVIPADCPCLKVRCWHGELHLGEAEYTPKSCRTRQRKKSPSACYFSSYIESTDERHRYCGIIKFGGGTIFVESVGTFHQRINILQELIN